MTDIREKFLHKPLIRRMRPTPTDAYLENPHKGCCTTNAFAGEPARGTRRKARPHTVFPDTCRKVAAGYLPCTVAYFKLWWRDIEPEKGKIDFERLDEIFGGAEEHGQTLGFHFYPHGPEAGPPVPDWFSSKYPMTNAKYGKTWENWSFPVYDSPEYLEQYGAFISAIGARYDGHPLLDFVDIAYAGPWGEGAGEYSEEQADRFAAVWKQAFANTALIANIAGKQLAAGIRAGTGWRCGCFGDLQPGGHSYGWHSLIGMKRAPTDPLPARACEMPRNLSYCQMYDHYPRSILQANADKAWPHAPVFFETCWTPMDWYQWGFDLDFNIQQGLKYHCTYVQFKQSVLPEPWLAKLHDFCKRMGYRFVFRQAAYDPQVAAGGTFDFQIWIENVGVAPLYRNYQFALRFRQGNKEIVRVLEDVDPRTWLPGDVWIERELPCPAELEPGLAEVSAGLVDPRTGKCGINFAVKERYNDRWIPIGDICLTR